MNTLEIKQVLQQEKINILLIGFPKCGTTSLSNWLDLSSFIYFSKPKETFSLCPEFSVTHSEIVYSKHFFLSKKSSKATLRIEGTTLNVYSDTLLKEVKADRNIKVLVIFRNPHDALFSWHNQMIKAGFIRGNETFEDIWKKGINASNTIPNSGSELLYRYDFLARYGFWLSKWFEELGHERLLIIHNNELKDSVLLKKRLENFFDRKLDIPATPPKDNTYSRLRYPNFYYLVRDSGIIRLITKLENSMPLLRRLRKKYYSNIFLIKSQKEVNNNLEQEVNSFFKEDYNIAKKIYKENIIYWSYDER